ncbi:TetR/AcrR family transcriptional regulator [Microbacterium sp. NPDC057407]|uniref:TetR/AcrR family transcriptional regulator n=1 Tax=Microbacterium sp. NPDC057407 TaxID=3346120 RepID=UPI00366EF040
MASAPYHHGNLRTALLERAWDVIDADGVEALSLRGLARDVGVSHGASARHFRDRQALLDAVAVEGFARLNAALGRATGGEGPFADRLRAAGEAYIAFAVRHGAILDVMYAAKHHPEATDELVAASHVGMTGLVELFTAAQASGEAAAGDAERQALVAFAAVHGVAALATADLLNGVEWQDAADAVLSFLTAGVRA